MLSRRPVLFSIGLLVALAATFSSVFGLHSALSGADPVPEPPHVERPAEGATAPLPLAAVGGDSPAAVLAEIGTWVEGVQRAEAEAQERARRDAASRATPGSVGVSRSGGSSSCGSDWDCFRECTIDHESRSSGEYVTNTGNGYYGAFQFAQSTWDAVAANAGYGEWVGRPASDAPKEVQDAVARFLWEHSGNRPWGGRC